jgi:uncharacterized membrane protein YhhN
LSLKKQTMLRLLLPTYILLSLLHLWAVQLQSEALILATKPLLLSLLALWFYLRTRPLEERFPRFILAGLIFSIGGDTLLMLVDNGPRGEQFFLYGLGSFLLAQLSYLLGFANYPGAKGGAVTQGPWRVWPFVLYLGAIIAMLWPGIPGPLQAPVAVYAAAIVGMAIAAFNLRPLLPREVFLGLMAGILLFVLSDSLIAIGKFRSDAVDIPYPRLLIMSTYLAGQYFIARNCVRMVKIIG